MSEETTETAEESPKTFTQQELDSIISDRLTRERAKFADYEDLKQTNADLTKQVSAIEDLKAEAYENGKAETVAEYSQKLIDTEVNAQALLKGFSDPNDALVFLGDRESLFDSKNGLNHDAISERLDELTNTKPYLLKTATDSSVAAPHHRPTLKQGQATATDQKVNNSAAALRGVFSKSLS